MGRRKFSAEFMGRTRHPESGLDPFKTKRQDRKSLKEEKYEARRRKGLREIEEKERERVERREAEEKLGWSPRKERREAGEQIDWEDEGGRNTPPTYQYTGEKSTMSSRGRSGNKDRGSDRQPLDKFKPYRKRKIKRRRKKQGRERQKSQVEVSF